MGKLSLRRIKRLPQALPFIYSLHLCSVSQQVVLGSNCSVQQGRRWDWVQQAQLLNQRPRDSSSFRTSVSGFQTLGDPRHQLFQNTNAVQLISQLIGGPSSCGYNSDLWNPISWGNQYGQPGIRRPCSWLFLGKNYQVNKPGVSQLVSLLPGRGILVLNQIEFEIPVPGLQGFGTWASPLNSSLF